MKSDSGKISIVDDDESVRTATRALLRSFGYQVQTFPSAELFLDCHALRETDCLLLDVRMPGIGGLELQRRLNAVQSQVPIIFVTAHDDRSSRMTAIHAGAASVFAKPFEANALIAAIQAALESRPGSKLETLPHSGTAPCRLGPAALPLKPGQLERGTA